MSVVVFAIALSYRVFVALFMADPSEGTWDWWTYSRVAANILRGCGVSLSDPTTAACVPHFGGNGLPGYPAFIAATWALIGRSETAILLTQGVLAALAIARLSYATRIMSGSALAAWSIGVVLAFSPWDTFWARLRLTETLAIAAATWLLSELCLSIAARRVRTFSIAAPFVVGLFLRLDFIAFAAPVAVVVLWISPGWRDGWRDGLRRGVVLGAVAMLPFLLWEVRNIAEGVPVVPPTLGFLLPDGSQGPTGYLAWVKTWARTEQQRNDATWFNINSYEIIKIPPLAFGGNPDADRARDLLKQMVSHSGGPVPAVIDDGFRELARRALAHMSLLDLINLRAAQTVAMWAPWMNVVPDTYRPEGANDLRAGIHVSWAKVMAHKGDAVVRFGMWGYRFLLFFGLLVGTSLVVLRYTPSDVRCLIVATWALILLKLAISVPGLYIENRLTAVVSPFIELDCVLVALTILQWRIAYIRRHAPAE